MSPALRQARSLIADGAIGRVLNARLYSATVAFGPKWRPADAYFEDPANGATLLDIHGGHAIDAALAVLGPFGAISALLTTQYPEVQVGDHAKTLQRAIPDHMLLRARLAMGGAGLSVEVVGGRPPESRPFRLEVTGEKGELALHGGAPRGFQSGRLAVSVNGDAATAGEGELAGLPDTAINVGGVYAALRDDIAIGTQTAPSFDHAVRLSRLMDDVQASSDAGERKSATGWPER